MNFFCIKISRVNFGIPYTLFSSYKGVYCWSRGMNKPNRERLHSIFFFFCCLKLLFCVFVCCCCLKIFVLWYDTSWGATSKFHLSTTETWLLCKMRLWVTLVIEITFPGKHVLIRDQHGFWFWFNGRVADIIQLIGRLNYPIFPSPSLSPLGSSISHQWNHAMILDQR